MISYPRSKYYSSTPDLVNMPCRPCTTWVQTQAQLELETREKDILQLEQNITDIRDMFVDLACLTAEQAAMLDRYGDVIEGMVITY